MSIDRILQLKLVADVSDINRKTGGAVKEVGRVRGAVRGLGAFAGPVMISLGITAAKKIADGLVQGFADSEAYDKAASELTAKLKKIKPRMDVSGLLADLDSVSFDLGFDDAETVAGFNKLLARAGKVKTAHELMAMAFDLARTRSIPLGAAVSEVGNIYKGEGEKLAEYGVVLDKPVKNSITNVRKALGFMGQEAEKHAGTIEGLIDRAGVMADRGFATLATAILDVAEDALPKLQDLWTEFGPDVKALAEDFGTLIGKIVELAGAVLEKLEPVLRPFATFLIDGFGAALETVIGIFDSLILLLNGDVREAFESIKKTAENTFTGFVGAFRGPMNVMLGAVEAGLNFLGNAFVGALEEIRGHANNIAFVGDHVPDQPFAWGGISVPRLARGGIVTGPTLALIGEGGHDEAVIPLDGRAMGGITINVYAAAASPADVGRAVVEAIEAHERRAGAAWRGAA